MYAWRRDDESAGHSVGSLRSTASGWAVDGAEILVGQETLACWFTVELDREWVTQAVRVEALTDAGRARLALAVGPERRWTADGTPRPDLDGCVDVDVAATPLTNTFPIRRLQQLAVGESRTAPVAWVSVPDLAVSRVDQTYRRLDERRWEYSDPTHGAFVLEVDADGVVLVYEGFAVRISDPTEGEKRGVDANLVERDEGLAHQ